MKKLVFLAIQLFFLYYTTNCQNTTGYIQDSRDGEQYNIVKIGNQWWMAENLKATHYTDGTPLVDGTGVGSIIGDYTTKYWFVYNDNMDNRDTYGLLYTWAAVMNEASSSSTNPSGVQGVCPTGWHIPSSSEWIELSDFLGGESVAGGKLKEAGTLHWNSPNLGATNESGFTALPGGVRDDSEGISYHIGTNGYWWSSENVNDMYARLSALNYSYERFYPNIYYPRTDGFSVRCVIDNLNKKCLYINTSIGQDILAALNELNYNVIVSDVFFSDLSDYDLVICVGYKCNTTTANYIKNYIGNGGAAVILGAAPYYFAGNSTNLSNIESWLGVETYSNVDNSYAHIAFDNPIGTNFSTGDIVGYNESWGGASVRNPLNETTVISTWDYSTGNIHSFIHPYQSGRVSHINGQVDYSNNSKELFKALCQWAADINNNYIPTVTIGSPSNLTTTSVNVDGNVTNVGNPSAFQHGHVWSTSPDPTVNLSTKTQLGPKTTPGSFQSPITPLQPNTTYYVKAYAENSQGPAYSGQITVKTHQSLYLPTVTIGGPSNLTTTSVNVDGNVTNVGNPSAFQHGHVWSISPDPTVNLSTKTQLGTKPTAGSFQSPITQLQPNTTYYIRAYAENSQGSAYSDQISVKTSNLTQLIIEGLEINADAISSFGTYYNASGNVNINNVLYFDDDLKIYESSKQIEGDCRIYLTNIYNIGLVELYEGVFKLDLNNGALTFQNSSTFNNLFELSHLPIYIDKLELSSDGVLIEGALEFPEIMGHLTIDIYSLEISKSKGINFHSEILISDVKLYELVTLQELNLMCNTFTNSYYGSAILDAGFFGVSAEMEIIDGLLNKVGMGYSPKPAIPLGSTGFSISDIHGGLNNLIHGPLELRAGVDLIPSIDPGFEIVKFNDLDITFAWGKSFTGSGELLVFSYPVFEASLTIEEKLIKFNGEVNLFDIIHGEIGAALVTKNNQIDFYGRLYGDFSIPDKPGMPYDIIRAANIELPHTIANTENRIKNNILTGYFCVDVQWLWTFDFCFDYQIVWENNFPVLVIGRNWAVWNDKLFDELFLQNFPHQSNLLEGKSLIINSNNYSKSLKSTMNSFNQSFEINEYVSQIIIRISGDSDVPESSLKLPDGSVISKNDNPGIQNAHYIENNLENKSFYLISNPPLGDWEVQIENAEEDILLDVFGKEASPYILMDSIILQSYNNANISWTKSDPRNNAVIDLYYDNDNKDSDGILIASNNNENSYDYYIWNYSDLPSGIYYVYAVISDSISVPKVSYTPNYIKHVDSNALTSPYNLTGLSTDTSIILSWNHNSPSNNTYKIYYVDNENTISYQSPSYGVGSANSFEFNNFIPGKTYKFFVTAIDQFGYESDYSNIISVEYISPILNNAPSLKVTNIPKFTFVDSVYFIELEAEDPDGDNLSFNLKRAPDNMFINQYGRLMWLPEKTDVGIHLIKACTYDSNNLSDSISFYLSVYDKTSYSVQLNINKTIYTSYCDNAIILINDNFSNTSSLYQDTIQLKLRSTANPTGMDILIYETNKNSGIFSSILNFSKSASEKSLQLNSFDAIKAEYFNKELNKTISQYATFNNKAEDVKISVVGSLSEPDHKVLLIAESGFKDYLWSDGSTTSDTLVVTQPGTYSVFVTDEYGCIGVSESIVVSVTYLTESKLSSSDIYIIPNPAKDFISLQLRKDITDPLVINILDITGRQIISKKFPGLIKNTTNIIDISEIQYGVYILVLESKDTIITKQIIKK